MTEDTVKRLAAALRATQDTDERIGLIVVQKDRAAEAILAADPFLASDIEFGQEWRETVAVLPVGWQFHQLLCLEGADLWEASASRLIGPAKWDFIEGTGPGPAEALSALRQALQEMSDG